VPRPSRIIGAGLTYHVYARGNNREAIFREDADRKHYLTALADAKSLYGCRLFAYVLMTNHVHASRFQSRVIQTNGYLLQCSCYIHLNPFRAGLVQRPEDYRWSSYRTCSRGGTPEGVREPTSGPYV
jgi:putative transposase